MTTVASQRAKRTHECPVENPPPGAAIGPDDLRELLQAVTQTTGRLQETHNSLQQEVARLQMELAEANASLTRSRTLAELGQMAAGIAHEIRNPLASLQLYAQMLAEESAARPAEAALCGKITQAVLTMEAIVRNVLAFARQSRISMSPASTGELLRRAATSCEALIVGTSIRLVVADSPGLPLHADVDLLTQALVNVVRNAIEAVAVSINGRAAGDVRGTTVRLTAERRRVRCPGGGTALRIVLRVEDDGDGIPAEHRERIFTPFFTTRPTGTGLGLAIVHRIVDAHGGHVRIGQGESGGASVELCLPIPQAVAEANKVDGPIVSTRLARSAGGVSCVVSGS